MTDINMKGIEIDKRENSNCKQYNIRNRTAYHSQTKEELIDVLEKCRINKIRIEIDYWDVNTNRSWWEKHDIKGYVWRSTWFFKIPLLIYNSRSIWGGGILDHCIIGIKTTNWGNTLYTNRI